MSKIQRSPAEVGAQRQQGPFRRAALAAFTILTIEIGLTVLTGALAASLVWTLLYGGYRIKAPTSPTAGRIAAGPAALERDTRSAARLFALASRAAPGQVEILPESQLGFALFGVRTGASPEEGGAILEAGAGGQRSIAAGDELQPGITLAEVHDDRVVINRRGAREVLYLSERARQRRQAAAEPLIPVTIAGLTLTPHPLVAGGEGLRLDTADGLPAALGLRAGDVIASIDGQPVSTELIVALSNSLASGRMPSSITLQRDSERLTFQTRQIP